MNDTYWQQRKDLAYYRTVLEFSERRCPGGKTLLDVGGGIGMGCRYLEWFDEYDRTSLELSAGGCTLDGVRVIHGDFLEWTSDRPYDLVLCLQVLEHVSDPGRFARKLFEHGRIVIVSVPYRWKAGTCKHHLHDPVDEEKLRTWTGRDPEERTVAAGRLVSVYR